MTMPEKVTALCALPRLILVPVAEAPDQKWYGDPNAKQTQSDDDCAKDDIKQHG
jgi:hypothetical protein